VNSRNRSRTIAGKNNRSRGDFVTPVFTMSAYPGWVARRSSPVNQVPSMMSSAEKPKYHTVEEYLALEEQAQTKSEYIDGWIRAMTGSSNRHSYVSINCLVSLANQLKGKRCRPFHCDTKVRINREGSKRFYYPDVQVVCQPNDPMSVFQDQPVLIIEVLSPSTRRYDLDEKMTAYLTIPSLECCIALEQHQPIAIVMRRIQRWVPARDFMPAGDPDRCGRSRP